MNLYNPETMLLNLRVNGYATTNCFYIGNQNRNPFIRLKIKEISQQNNNKDIAMKVLIIYSSDK